MNNTDSLTKEILSISVQSPGLNVNFSFRELWRVYDKINTIDGVLIFDMNRDYFYFCQHKYGKQGYNLIEIQI